jgi:hypothetical protein
MSIPGQSIVSATIPSYAGGSVVATFQPQGGGKPVILQNAAMIDSIGHFSLSAWDNTNALYKPSATVFCISVGATAYAVIVSIAGTIQDISSAFVNATQPPSAIGAVQITNTPLGSGKIMTSTGATTAAWT